MAPRILLIEDDRAIVEFISLGLRYEGYEVTAALTGEQALRTVRDLRPDLIILDVMLPDRSGLDVLSALRESGLPVPVIIVSAQFEVTDRVEGLEAGADDYLTKPFRFEELLARIRAVMRRHGPSGTEEVLACGAVRLELASRQVTVDGKPTDVSGLEYQLLELLLANVGRVLTREVLMKRVWGFDWIGESNVLEAHVSKLRRLLGEHGPILIRTVRGVGYVLRAPL